MKKIKHVLASFLILVTASLPLGMVSIVTAPQAGAVKCDGNVLSIPVWYKNLDCKKDGNSYTEPKITKLNDVWLIALNVVEALIIIAAYVAAGFITWGGITYIRSRGEPGKTAEAKGAIINAVIGLAIALASTAIVRFVQGLIAQ